MQLIILLNPREKYGLHAVYVTDTLLLSRTKTRHSTTLWTRLYSRNTPVCGPDDTLDNMIEMVGGVEELEKSMEFVMWAAMLEFMIADQTPEVRNIGA